MYVMCFQASFEDSSVQTACQCCLTEMQESADALRLLAPADTDQLTQMVTTLTASDQQWRGLVADIATMHVRLAEVPEKWRRYNQRWAEPRRVVGGVVRCCGRSCGERRAKL